MISPLLLTLLAQVPVQTAFDDGAIAGRVCADSNRDGACGADEAGLPGVRVVLETGLTALTDAAGRYHLAAVPGRAPDTLGGGRLLPGRHRVKVDDRWLPADTRIAPSGATVEVPFGALVLVDFAVAEGADGAQRLELDERPFSLRAKSGVVEYELAFKPSPGAELRVRGAPIDGASAWITLDDGANDVPVTLAREGQLELAVQRIDVVRRVGSTLVIPRALRPVGRVSLDAQGLLRAALLPKSQLQVGAEPLLLDDAGSAVKQTEGDLSLSFDVGGVRWKEPLARPGPRGVFAVGLLDVEAAFDVRRGAFQVFGRGAGAVRARLAGFDLGAELDLRDADVEALRTGTSATTLLAARRQDVFERQLDPARVTLAWADSSATVATNPGEGRLRLEIAREGWGRAGYGSARLALIDSDLARYHRAVQGAFLQLETPKESLLGASLRGVAAPTQSDALTGLARRPAHERFESTGGSLFFLSHTSVVQGSELVRVEWRDAVSGLPVRDVHLARNRDYSIDALSGRLLLARPLSFIAAESLLQTDPLSTSIVAVLVVDYEYTELSASGVTLGGEAGARVGPARVSFAALRDGSYDLLRVRGEAKLGPVHLSIEGAKSRGQVQGLAASNDGGLSFLTPSSAIANAEGLGLTVRARTAGLFGRGWWDAAWRVRQEGFEDVSGIGGLSQVALRGEQPLGPFVVTALVDLHDLADPRDPFSGMRIKGRTIGGGVGYERETWGVRLEVRDVEQLFFDPNILTFAPVQPQGAFSVGVAGRYRVTNWLQLRAGYRQRLLAHAIDLDDTFASAGVDVKPTEQLELGVRGGWGPRTGPLAWGTVSYQRAEETWYGAHSLDVDAPGAGERRLVTGVRQQVDPGTAVFVEDVSASDPNGLRLARAVGVTQRLGDALSVTARYEHGARSLAGARPDVGRDAGGVTAAWETRRVRLFTRGEVRAESTGLAQWLATAGGEASITESISASARFQFTHASRGGLLESRLVDGTAALAWRFGIGMAVARYTYQQELRSGRERRLHLVSLLPALKFGDRFRLAAGAHLAHDGDLLASGSIRPSVRIVAGLEVAAEAAARTSAPDAGSLTALRGEVGYRFDDRFFVGAGFTAFGFSGTGLESGATGSRDRVYLRAEVSY